METRTTYSGIAVAGVREAIETGGSVPVCEPVCRHCRLPIPISHSGSEGFCCAGCEGAFALIHDLGLSDYYALRERADTSTNRVEGVVDAAYYDDPNFLNEYAARLPDGTLSVRLYLVGMHCAACVWLLESLPRAIDGVRASRVEFARQIATVTFDPSEVALSGIVRTIARLGYAPHAVSPRSAPAMRRVNRDTQLRIGVAAVSAANTMMFAVSLYQGWFTGMEEKYAQVFNWMSLLFAVPAVLWSALPFYRAAWLGLRTRTLHIDIPISIAIVLAFAVSVTHTLQGNADVYYDTICMLIFLLLGARWLQQLGLARAQEGAGLLAALLPLDAVRIRNGVQESVYIDSIVAGDILAVDPGRVVPADGEILDGRSSVSTASLTGESTPVPIGAGEIVFAGTTNLTERVTMKVLRGARESRLGQLISQVESGPTARPPIVVLTDRIAGRFVAVIMMLSLGTILGWTLAADFPTALSRTLALLVITCPCAAGLAAPLTMAVALRRAASLGLFIKSEDAIERLARTQHIFIDKTGTATEGYMTVTSALLWNGSGFVTAEPADPRWREIGDDVLELERASRHPIRGALERFFADVQSGRELSRYAEVREHPSLGLEGLIADGRSTFVGSLRWFHAQHPEALSVPTASTTPVVLWNESGPRALFFCGDKLRAGMTEFVESSRSRGVAVSLLSGDIQPVVNGVARELGIESVRALAARSPEEKVRILREAKEQHTTMIGDGANDAAALRAAGCGIALTGGAEVSLRASDAYLVDPSGFGLERLFTGARNTLRLIRTSLIVSSMYNLTGATLAIAGYVTPLVAALVMPLSSLTVVLIGLHGRSFSREEFLSQSETESKR